MNHKLSLFLILLSSQWMITCTVSAKDSSKRDALLARPEIKGMDFQHGPENRWAFSNIDTLIPISNIEHSIHPRMLDGDSLHPNDVDIFLNGEPTNLGKYLKSTYVDGFVLLKNGKVVIEGYYGALDVNKPHIMFSMTKSIVGTLAGILIEKGVIDTTKTVDFYVPALSKSGWVGESIRDLMDMRVGSDWVEDYEAPNSSIAKLDCAGNWQSDEACPVDYPKTMVELLTSIGRNEVNDDHFVYKSGDTDVMVWVIESATGERLASLISKHIWKPMGAATNAYITIDDEGFAMGDGGMSATTRDMVSFGQMILDDGKVKGVQVVPTAYITDIKNQRGDKSWPYNKGKNHPYYRSFWWGVGNGLGDIQAQGIHGQTVYIASSEKMVIAINSSWPRALGTKTTNFSTLSSLLKALLEKYKD